MLHQASILALGEAWGSLRELILKAEGFLKTPPTFKSCPHPLHPVHPAGKAVLFCHQMPSLGFKTGLCPAPCLGGGLTERASQL